MTSYLTKLDLNFQGVPGKLGLSTWVGKIIDLKVGFGEKKDSVSILTLKISSRIFNFSTFLLYIREVK